MPVTLYSAVDDEVFGRLLVASLRAQGVAAHYVLAWLAMLEGIERWRILAAHYS